MPSSRVRPLSPHLQIYRPQLTSILSIFHRITGIGLCLVAMTLIYWLWALTMGEKHYETALWWFTMPIGKAAVFLVLWGFFFHLTNGLRHLACDFGYGFDRPTVTINGYTVLFISFALTLWTWFGEAA